MNMNKSKSKSKSDSLIVALDVPDRAAADILADQLGDEVHWFKIGLELFCAEGPGLVRDYVARDRKIFVDLKLHDIPETVRRATTSIAKLGATMLTIHAAGGVAMMNAAVQGAHHAGGKLKILAVTALTSLDDTDLRVVGIDMNLPELVVKRARLAAQAGCDGVVASPHEAKLLRASLPPDFLIVTPGVRPKGTPTIDQKRVMTPLEARRAGADMVVVGRPIRDAADPLATARSILAELAL